MMNNEHDKRLRFTNLTHCMYSSHVLSSHAQVHERLEKDLPEISSEIQRRGGAYTYLDPINVGCSIDI